MLTAIRRSIPGSRRPQRAAGTPGAAAGLAPLSSTSTLGENITYAVARSKFGAHLLPVVNGTRKHQVSSLSCPPSGSPSAEWAAISTGRAAAQSGTVVVESPNRFGGPALGNHVARSYYMGRTNGNLGGSRTREYAGASSAGGLASMGAATVSSDGRHRFSWCMFSLVCHKTFYVCDFATRTFLRGHIKMASCDVWRSCRLCINTHRRTSIFQIASRERAASSCVPYPRLRCCLQVFPRSSTAP